MAARERKKKPSPTLGSEAFGADPDGRPTGSDAFGGGDDDAPLRGADAIGNAPSGDPAGSEAFGGTSAAQPLKGALLIGNDPSGHPTGSEAVGGSGEAQPLRGAILFGNDPHGNPTGAEAFGTADDVLSFRGSEAIGAPQLVPEKLHKDQIGYDFGGRLMLIDEMSMAGIRKDPRDRLRGRVLAVLGRLLACEPDRLRHGLNEQAIPWGRLRRDRSLDKPLAEELRRWYRKAPGETLGIGHVRDLLEGSNRMHSFALHCEWDRAPMLLAVHRGDEVVAYGESQIHMQHTYFVFRDPDGTVLAYVDTLVPRRRDQTARVRAANGDVVATFALKSPNVGEAVELGDYRARFEATISHADGKPLFLLREERATERYFRADLLLPDSEELIGSIEDRLRGGKIRTQIELDLVFPPALAWGLAAIAADLSRLRRRGWPDAAEGDEEKQIESVEEALGKPRDR